MKVIIIYSGKGGVGKTSTTANLARSLVDMGKRVFILDCDLNTPSMHVIFPDERPNENLFVDSIGYTTKGMIYVQKSLIKKYIGTSIQKIKKEKPDFVLVDTPPSITDVHINLIEKLKVSGIVMITQPTELSVSDVSRTAGFFQERKIPLIGVLENMTFKGSPEIEYAWKRLGKIPFEKGFDANTVFSKHKPKYNKVCRLLMKLEDVVVENKRRLLFDETITVEDAKRMYDSNIRFNRITGRNYYRNIRFINVKTWNWVKEQIEDQNVGLYSDQRMMHLTKERVGRLVEAFRHEEVAYFMVTQAPNTEIQLFAGEIGECTMKQSEAYWGIPCAQYKTAKGEVTLFPYEVKPATQKDIQHAIQWGSTILPDGRYIPSRDTLREIWASFGSRVMSAHWEENYDKQVKLA